MKVTHGIEHIVTAAGTIATLGSFDGVHLGHRDILRSLTTKRDADRHSRAVVMTFDPHPQEVLRRNDTSVQLLTTIEERLELLASTGVDETVVIRFDKQFSQTPYAEFFRSVIVERLGTTSMVVGFNHAFGKNREGDIAHLKLLGAQAGVEISEVPPHLVDDVQISSTKIRAALAEADVRTAARYLGRSYDLSGTVIDGDKLGRTFGFPTANIEIPQNKLVPKDGVYSALATVSGHQFLVALSIGTRPTVGEGLPRVVEALLLDFDGDLYGQSLRIELTDFIRPQAKFDSFDELKAKMTQDVEQVRNFAR